MMRRAASAVPLLLAWAALSPARGEVVDSAPGGFTVKHSVMVDAPAQAVYRMMVHHVDRWWSSEHTFSGDSRNLFIEDRANGCFCERLRGRGSVRHLTVIYSDPDRMIRLSGGLGPLQAMAVAGSMTWRLAEDRGRTTIEMEYCVGGYHPGGLAAFAGPVDGVLREQMERLGNYIETGDPEKEPKRK